MRGIIVLLFLCISASAENLMYNSSFECGASGWFTWGNPGPNVPQGNTVPLGGHVVSTNGVGQHGNNAFFFWPLLYSRALLTPAGTYTLTFKVRGASSTTMQYGLQRTYEIRSITDPTNAVSLTTSWQSVTNVIVVTTNGWHALVFKHTNTVIQTWIDSIQLESGSTASAYAPRTLEFGIDTANFYNVLFLSDAKTARFKIRNEGAQTNITIVYQDVHGIYNSNIQSGTIITNALAATGNTTINLALPTLNGPHRLFAYVTNVNNSWDETGITMLPFDAQTGRDFSGLLGIHPAYEHLGFNRTLGFTHARIFSPIFWSRWESQFPTLATTNMFPAGTWNSDYVFQACVTNDVIPFVTLTPPDVGTFPGNGWHPETNASISVMIGDWTNYVGRMVARYSGSPYFITNWEVFNEPQQEGRQGVNVKLPDNYANVYTNAANLIRLISPSSFIIAFGGFSTSSDATDAWSAIGAGWQGTANAVSFHIYPKQTGLNDPNLLEDWRGDGAGNFTVIKSDWTGVKPYWNSETAILDAGGYHTINSAYCYPYYWDGSGNESSGISFGGSAWANEAQFNEMEGRQLPSMDRITYNFCRTVGHGFAHFNLQYSRANDTTSFRAITGPQAQINELNDSLKPWVSPLLIAKHFLKRPGLGPLTNKSSYYVEAYMHTNTLGVVIPIWNMDRGTRSMSITNDTADGQFAYYDTCGNLIQTNATNFVVTRSVRYIVSGSRTLMQLSNAIQLATGTTNSDTTAPNLTIDMSPIGQMQVWGGTTNAYKATAVDERVMQWGNASTEVTNVQYRWTFNDTSTWSPWGNTNHFYHSFAAPGLYRVGWQAKDQANNLSETVYTPYFGNLGPVMTNIINISGAANVGTLNIP